MNDNNGNISYIVEKYSDMVYRTAFAYLGSAADAEDAVSEVMLKYFSQHDRGEFSSEQHVKAWLLRVTVNHCKDVLKSFRVKNTLPLDASPESLLDLSTSVESDTKLDIAAALDTLPPDYRIVLYLYYYQEYSTKEIARCLDIPKNTVVSRLSRARKALRQKLKGYDNGVADDTDDISKKGVTHNYA